MSNARKSAAAPPRTLRETHTALTRTLLLDAAWALAQAGAEPSMRAVAARAGVAERTVYRYFANLDALVDALSPFLVGRAGIPLCERADQLEGYAAELFATFDRNAALVTMILTSPWWLKFARRSRTKNLAGLRRLIDDAFPRAPVSDRAAAAATLRAVLSGSGWLYLRESCGLSHAELVRSTCWMVRTHLRALGRAR